MNLNSQYALYPPQPDNPTDDVRYLLLKNALMLKGWPEDLKPILKRMAPPPPITGMAPPGSFKNTRVGVIGGGLAGLSAAYELRKMGFDITVFDALADRVGGRVYTYYFGSDPTLYGEFGPMRVPVAHESVWHYLKLFKLSTYPFIQYNPHGFVYLKNTRVRNDADGQNVRTFIYPKYALNQRERALSWQKLLYLGTDNHLLKASMRDRVEILETKQHYSAKTLEWINRSNIAMLEAAGLSQSAINLVPNFNPLLEGNLYSSFIDFIQEDYPASTTYAYSVRGGSSMLPAAFYRSYFDENPYPELPTDTAGRVIYRPGCTVSGIYMGDNGKTVALRYSLPRGAAALETFDYIVCAIPFATLRNIEISPLFSGIKMRAIREVNYTPAQKTLLCFAERFWEAQGILGGPSFTDLPIGSLWYNTDRAISYSDSSAASAPGVIIGSYNFNLDTTRLLNQQPEAVQEEVVREIAAVHGLAAEDLGRIVRGFKFINWNQEPTFRGALSFYTPEQKRLFAYGMALPEYDNRVFFAGEHISAVHRWMQGALQTGMQAANDLVRAAIGRQPEKK